jgi:hypothetical protein
MMVTGSVALCVGSVLDFAVIVTVIPVGTAAGAVNIVWPPSTVCADEKAPQAPDTTLPHVTDQSTPAFAASLLTVAIKGAVAFRSNKSFGTFFVI